MPAFRLCLLLQRGWNLLGVEKAEAGWFRAHVLAVQTLGSCNWDVLETGQAVAKRQEKWVSPLSPLLYLARLFMLTYL